MGYTPTMGQREDLYSVSCKITGTDGKVVKYTMDKMDGGDATANETKYRPGNGTNDQVTLGGSNTISNITLTGLMNYAMYQDVPWLISQNGKAAMSVYKQPLDNNGSPFGKALIYTGLLQGVTPPKTDSSSDAAGVLALVQSSVTPVTTG